MMIQGVVPQKDVSSSRDKMFMSGRFYLWRRDQFGEQSRTLSQPSMRDYTTICGLAGRIILSRQELSQSLNNDIP